jgi:hypothetical protein
MELEDVRASALKGNVAAAVSLGVELSKNLASKAEAIKWLRIAGENPLAQAILANLLFFDVRGMVQDGAEAEEARALARASASAGEGLGYFLLGLDAKFQSKHGNYEEALSFFTKAVEVGCLRAEKYRAAIFSDYGATQFNIDEASAIAVKLEQQGVEFFGPTLAAIHMHRGRMAEGVKALTDGVAAGDPASMLMMATLHRYGKCGVKRSEQMATDLENMAKDAKRWPFP